MKYEGRKLAFKALVGSHNYNLNTPESDKDYKVFVLPTYDDLYFGNTFKKNIVGDTEDLDIHDIRRCSNFWYNSNNNFVQVLFSEEWEIGEELSIESKDLIKKLFDMKDRIARMNLIYLFESSVAIYHQNIKRLENSTEKTKNLIQRYGYNTKMAVSAYRSLDSLARYADNGFSDFKQAIWYSNNDKTRELLLEMRSGKYSLEEVKNILALKLEEVESRYESIYRSYEVDESVNTEVIRTIQKLILLNLS